MRKIIPLLIVLALLLVVIPAAVSANENDTVLADIADDDDDNVFLEISSMATIKYALPGDQVNITVFVNNYGPKPAKNVTVKTEMPSNLPLNLKVSEGTFDYETGIWTIGDMKADKEARMKIITKSDELGKYTFDFKVKCDSELWTYSMDELTVEVNIVTQEELERALTPSGPVSGDDDVREGEQRSFYSASAYSNYRQVTSSTNNTVEAKMNEHPTANPIALALMSMCALIGAGLKKKKH